MWFDLHSWVGLKLCVLMAFVCLTGTLAVFSHEIDWALHPQMRVSPAPQHASWGTMVSAVQRAYPAWTLNGLSAPKGPRSAAMASMETDDGRLRFVWVDPYRGTVTGDTHWFNAQRFLRNTHRHLMMPVKFGVPIVSALSIALLVTLVTSLVIYKKWWRGFLSLPRPERQRRFWGDVHRLAGVWSLWFIALIAVTGGWYLVESLGGGAGGQPDVLPKQPADADAAVPIPITPAAIDRAIAQAQHEWPTLEVRRLALSERGLVIEGQAEAWLVRDRANALGFDPTGSTLTGRRIAGELDVHHRISEMADPLHFGTFGGLVTQVIWFAFGLLLTALSLTGAYLYGLRVADVLRAATRRSAKSGAVA
ncbi:PepSY-associated TM helix domain-containing protein [Luteimonas kalidii]|uniref:PepSY-associated TM helix domain-containing protein n=1 Tax=Luteimonas kalidii TaxID=3042025 RepID=A0ABT6JSP5_9GAMM|nr:PepSY-associated TM helix domain-containing protein [Luteimonas kalidii]MDH5833705.1 PepSY-associated TM helix domain-containing protein [Luteimonas kalidii]